jgi:hypothetical protein
VHSQLIHSYYHGGTTYHHGFLAKSITAAATFPREHCCSYDLCGGDEGFSQMTTKERDAAVKSFGKEYAYGWRREEGGRVRWVVDEMQTKENRALMDHY